MKITSLDAVADVRPPDACSYFNLEPATIS